MLAHPRGRDLDVEGHVGGLFVQGLGHGLGDGLRCRRRAVVAEDEVSTDAADNQHGGGNPAEDHCASMGRGRGRGERPVGARHCGENSLKTRWGRDRGRRRAGGRVPSRPCRPSSVPARGRRGRRTTRLADSCCGSLPIQPSFGTELRGEAVASPCDDIPPFQCASDGPGGHLSVMTTERHNTDDETPLIEGLSLRCVLRLRRGRATASARALDS